MTTDQTTVPETSELRIVVGVDGSPCATRFVALAATAWGLDP